MLVTIAAVLAHTAAPGTSRAQSVRAVEDVKRGESCPRCDLERADLSARDLRYLNLSGAILRQADVSAAVVKDASLERSDLRALNAFGAVFTGSDLSGADLTAGNFTGAYLTKVNLRGAHLARANFTGAVLEGARGLTQSELSKACGDASTRLPRGFHIGLCHPGEGALVQKTAWRGGVEP